MVDKEGKDGLFEENLTSISFFYDCGQVYWRLRPLNIRFDGLQQYRHRRLTWTTDQWSLEGYINMLAHAEKEDS